jgi:hypothetical protein
VAKGREDAIPRRNEPAPHLLQCMHMDLRQLLERVVGSTSGTCSSFLNRSHPFHACKSWPARINPYSGINPYSVSQGQIVHTAYQASVPAMG